MSETCTVRPELIEFDKGNSQYLTIVAYPGTGSDSGFRFTSTDATTAAIANVEDGAELNYAGNLANMFANDITCNVMMCNRLEGIDTIALKEGSAMDMTGGDIANVGIFSSRAVNGNSILISDHTIDMNQTGDITKVNELKFFETGKTGLLTITNDSVLFGEANGLLNLGQGSITRVQTLELDGPTAKLNGKFGTVENVSSMRFQSAGSASGNVYLDMNMGQLSNVNHLFVGDLQVTGSRVSSNVDGTMKVEDITFADQTIGDVSTLNFVNNTGTLNINDGSITNVTTMNITPSGAVNMNAGTIDFGGAAGTLEMKGATASANISQLTLSTNVIQNLTGVMKVEGVEFNADAVSSMNTLAFKDGSSTLDMKAGTMNNVGVLNSQGGAINMNAGTLSFGGSAGLLSMTGNGAILRVGDMKMQTNSIVNENGSVNVEGSVFTDTALQTLNMNPLAGQSETNVFDAKFESGKMTVTNTFTDTIQPKSATNLTLTTPASAGTIDVTSKRVTNVATPVNDSDAANKFYVQQALQQNVQGLKPKTAVDHAALETAWNVDKFGYSNYFMGHTPNVDVDGNNNGLLTIYLKEAVDGNVDGSVLIDGVRITRESLNASAIAEANGQQPSLARKRILFNGLNISTYGPNAEVPPEGSSNLPADTYAANQTNVAGLNGIWEVVRMGTAISGDASTDRVQIASTAYWPLVLQRALDMNEDHEIMNGAYAYIKNGSAGVANYGFVVTNDDPLSLVNGLSTKEGAMKELKWVLFNNVNYELAFKTEQGAQYEELSTTGNSARFGKGGLLMRYDAADEKSIMVNTELLQYDTDVDALNVKGNLDFSTLTSTDTYVTCANDKFIDIMGSRFKAGALFEAQDIVTNTVTCESDVNLKKNITKMEDGRGLVAKLRPVTYHWKTDDVMDKIEYGFIAQEVEPEFPSLVRTNAETGIKSVDYQKMVSLLVLSVQELTAEVKELRSKMN